MRGDVTSRRAQRPLPEYLAQLARTQATGVLEARGVGGGIREIYFVNGEIRAVRSRLEEEMFGSWLVERGTITEDQKALTLLSQGSETAPPLGHLLVQRGLVDEEGLGRELEALTLTLVHRAASDTMGSYSFREGGTQGQPDTLPNVTTLQLLIEAARSYPDTERKLAMLGPFDQICWPNQSMESVVLEIELNPSEAYLLSRMGQSHRVADLESLCPMPRERLVGALYALKVAGLISLGDPARRPSKPMPAFSHQPHGAGAVALEVDESRLTPEQLKQRHEILKLAESVTRLDHYKALNLSANAARLDVRLAWEKLAERYAPERASEYYLADLRPQFQLIRERMEEAFEVLADPASRERYDRVMRTLKAGRSALEEDLHEERVEAARRAREELIEANTRRAAEFLRDGEVYQAIQLLEQVCDLDPTPQRLVQLAKLLVRNPLWAKQTLAVLRKALEADPKFTDAWVELAEFWRRRSNRELQRKALERALATEPENERAQASYRQLMGERDLERLVKRAHRR